jgi:hypothetical protein
MHNFIRQLTVSQFAQITHLPVRRVQAWVRTGALPAFKVDKDWYLDMSLIFNELSKPTPQFYVGKYKNHIM